MGLIENIIGGIITAAFIYGITKIFNNFRKKKYPTSRFLKQLRKYSSRFISFIEHPKKISESLGTFLIPIAPNFDLISNYVPLTAVEYIFKPTEHMTSFRVHEQVEKFLFNALKNNSHTHCFIIGDFGSGKSALITRLTYEISKKYFEKLLPVLPILIPMRYLQGEDIISEAARFLRERCNIEECSRTSLVEAVRLGKVVLLLDGLDEYMRLKENHFPTQVFKVLEEVLTNQSNVIITSRPSIFHTAEEFIEYFRGRKLAPSIVPSRIYSAQPMLVLELKELSNQQIEEILNKNGITDQNHIKLIFENSSLLELARHHILLDMIIYTLPQILKDVNTSAVKELKIPQLYEIYISQAIKRDLWQTSLSEPETLQICQKIALEMYNQHEDEFDESILNEIAADVIKQKHGVITNIREIVFHVRSSLLMTTAGDRRYRFIHRSIMEYFVAKGLIEAIRKRDFGGLEIKNIVYHEAISHFARAYLTERDIPILANLLEHENPWVRFTSSHYLSRLNSKEAVELIQKHLQTEKDFVVRREFYIALAFLGLVEHFHNFILELESDRIRETKNNGLIIDYFGNIPTALDGCSLRLSERIDYPTREMIIRFLGQFGSRKHIPILRRYLEDNIQSVKESTKIAINQIKSREGKPSILRGLLLDLDGVVVNSIEDHIEAWRKAFKEIINLEFDPDIIRLTEGMKSKEIAKEIVRLQKIEVKKEKIDEVIQMKRKLMDDLESMNIRLDTKQLIQRANKKGIAVVIVTGSTRKRAESVARTVGLDLIDSIIAEDDTRLGKPSPHPYLLGLERIRCSPSEALAIENAPLGIDSVQAAGIYCIALTSTLDKQFLQSADEILDDAEEVSRLFEQISS